MIYYKITNTGSETFKQFVELRKDEINKEIENLEKIQTETGLTFDSFIGNGSQQNLRRVKQYSAFKWNETDKIDPKIWKEVKKEPGYYEPNARTSAGKKMRDLIWNGLKSSSWEKPLKIVGVDTDNISRFIFPYVQVVSGGDIVILVLDDKFDLSQHPDLIEITRKEFNELNQLDE